MDTPNDRVTLTIEEQRALAALEDQAGREDPTLQVSLTAGWRSTRSHSPRVRDTAAGLCFLAGFALMLAAFAQWPALAAGGLVLQVVSLQALLYHRGPPARARVQQWIEIRHKASREQSGGPS